jgi:hypothetical protein
VVDLQCLWDAEAEFVRFGRGLLPKNNGQGGTAMGSGYKESILEIRLLGVALCRIGCLFWRMLRVQHFYVFWVVILARRFWFGTMEMSVERARATGSQMESLHKPSATEIEFWSI